MARQLVLFFFTSCCNHDNASCKLIFKYSQSTELFSIQSSFGTALVVAAGVLYNDVLTILMDGRYAAGV